MITLAEYICNLHNIWYTDLSCPLCRKEVPQLCGLEVPKYEKDTKESKIKQTLKEDS